MQGQRGTCYGGLHRAAQQGWESETHGVAPGVLLGERDGCHGDRQRGGQMVPAAALGMCVAQNPSPSHDSAPKPSVPAGPRCTILPRPGVLVGMSKRGMERAGLSCVQSASRCCLCWKWCVPGGFGVQVARRGCCRTVLSVCCDGFGLCVQQGLVSRAVELLGAGLSPPASTSRSYKCVCGPALGSLAPAVPRLAARWLWCTSSLFPR